MNDLAVFKPLNSLDRMFADIMEDFGKGFYDLGVSNRSLITNVEDKEDKYLVKAEVPGLDENSIDITFEDNILSISANYGEKEEDKDFKYLRVGKFSKSYRMPDVDGDKITADISNGILTIEVPKSEKSKPKKITVKKSK